MIGERDTMIAYRKKHRKEIREMAQAARVSCKLLRMIEEDAQCVTHPRIAERIGAAYKLTDEQIRGMIPANYRVGDPAYDPDRYKTGPEEALRPSLSMVGRNYKGRGRVTGDGKGYEGDGEDGNPDPAHGGC